MSRPRTRHPPGRTPFGADPTISRPVDPRRVDGLLAQADAQAALYPGEPGTRQPVHTVYVPAANGGSLPGRFVVTMPKEAHVAEVRAGVLVAERLEQVHGLTDGAIRLGLQIEVPRAVVGPDGATTVAALVHAGAGRIEGLHYGTYDFSAAAGVVAGEQSLQHRLADHAEAVMQLAAAQTGVRVSDGSTNVVPVGTAEQIGRAWQLPARLARREG